MYLVSEFVQGRTLSAYLSGHELDLPSKIGWIRDLALALDYAHNEGVIHRDIKTENVLVDEVHQRPQLTDFGLAKQIDEISSIQTQDGSLLALPPTWRRNRPGENSTRSGRRAISTVSAW